jgi:3-dehydroquinate synthase
MLSISAPKYTIYFNENGYVELNNLLLKNNYSGIFILTDENTNEHCLPKLLANLATEILIELIEIEAGESHKNMHTCSEIWSILSDLGADRKSVLINLGGGVITDLGGFIASTFKRGIDFINVPTTLLGMVDASIGGKNGVDLGVLKNQIGTFNEPVLLLIDSEYLATLSNREMVSGLAEMLKHGLIFDKAYWQKFHDISAIHFNEFDELIYRSIEIKNEIVSQDPTEKGIRKALNFGHTLGHGIESCFLKTETPLLHGEAIAIGMVLEAFISKEKGLLTEVEYLEIKRTLLSIYNKTTLDIEMQKNIIEILIHDKKNEFGTVQFALLNEIGNYKINQTTDNELIMRSFLDYNS